MLNKYYYYIIIIIIIKNPQNYDTVTGDSLGNLKNKEI